MKLPSLDEFWQRLQASGLLVEEVFQRARLQMQDVRDLPAVCLRLIAAYGLTRWQCKQLIQGRISFHLGKFRLLDQLGSGGMGTVFKAQRSNSPRLMALKVIGQKALQTPGSIERFRNEVRVLAALTHPNIIAAIDADSAGETHFLVMEYVEGRDLSRWQRNEPLLPVGWTCEVIRQAAVGLQFAHEHGIIHRDVKPGNILVVAEDSESPPVVKLLDLGMAHLVASDGVAGSPNDPSGSILGTPDYLAPEQARPNAPPDSRSDLYSLGCALFKALAGRPPFDGHDALDKIRARLRHDAPSILQFRADIPKPLATVIERMLARDPAERYQTAAEVAAALEPYSGFAEVSMMGSGVRSRPHIPGPPGSPGSLQGPARPAANLDDSSLQSTDPTTQLLEFIDRLSPEELQRAEEESAALAISGEGSSHSGSGVGLAPAPARRMTRPTTNAPQPTRTKAAAQAKLNEPATRRVAKSAPVSRQPALSTLASVGMVALMAGAGALWWVAWNAGYWSPTAAAPVVHEKRPEPPRPNTAQADAERAGAQWVPFEGIPLGETYQLDFDSFKAGRYRVSLHVLKAPAESRLKLSLNGQEIYRHRLEPAEVGPRSRIDLGLHEIGAGPQQILLTLPRLKPEGDDEEVVSAPALDFAVSLLPLPD